MMGKRQFEPKLFHSLSLEGMVPGDHLLRRLDKIVNLSFVRELCRPYYSHTGQPSIDPEVLFKMMFLGYLFGITSERRLAEECSLHLAFRWYLGYDLDEPTPDHSVLSKARARYGKDVFDSFFKHVLGLCVEAGLVSGEKIYADSTIVVANASVKSIVHRDQVFEPLLSPSEHLDKVFEENPIDCSESVLANRGFNLSAPEIEITESSNFNKIHRIPSSGGGGSSNDQETKFSPRSGRRYRGRSLNEIKVSATDPEASIITRPGRGTVLAYKEHFTVDGAHRVITAVEVTPAACEDSEEVPGLLDSQPLKPREFCADSHYGVPEVYRELRNRGILPVIPRRSPQTRRTKAGRLGANAFGYIPERDIYLCPQGRELKRSAYDARWHRFHYRPRDKDCRGCPIRETCCTSKTVRTVLRYPDQEAIDWAQSYLDTPLGQRTFSQRMVMAEWVIAEAKCFHGLRRALHHGVENVKIQALMIASVQNIKRLMANVSNRLSLLLRESYKKTTIPQPAGG